MVTIITDSKDTFIDVVNTNKDLEKWAFDWIKNDDKDIDFWEGGNISIDRNANEINIFGDNGMITLNFKNHIVL